MCLAQDGKSRMQVFKVQSSSHTEKKAVKIEKFIGKKKKKRRIIIIFGNTFFVQRREGSLQREICLLHATYFPNLHPAKPLLRTIRINSTGMLSTDCVQAGGWSLEDTEVGRIISLGR